MMNGITYLFATHFSRWFGPDAEVGGVTPLSKHHFTVAMFLPARCRGTLLSEISGLLSRQVVTGCSKVPHFTATARAQSML